MAKCGRPWRKLLVPSSGSMIHRGLEGSPSIVPPSSSTKPQSGRAARSSSHKVRSAAWSALDTKSDGPLRLTWRCSTSPKSRRSRPPALRAARSITRISPDNADKMLVPIVLLRSVDREPDRSGGNLDLTPTAGELELVPVACDRVDHAVVDFLAVGRPCLVDLQVVDLGEADVTAAIATLLVL